MAGWAHRYQMRTVVAEGKLVSTHAAMIGELRAAAPHVDVPVVVLSVVDRVH
jgi:3-deoxy-D-manno-octulosonic-acid transferase